MDHWVLEQFFVFCFSLDNAIVSFDMLGRGNIYVRLVVLLLLLLLLPLLLLLFSKPDIGFVSKFVFWSLLVCIRC